ncbi:MAG: sn-glycerol-3-phosphate ABC transporter ATP-binding protein UgpC [Chloroflexota bacterium]|nr:MAG: sn-glycerol-3-phosphate ABC transporter ATP-binding protein UgpC [Chloroflexota bacterium]
MAEVILQQVTKMFGPVAAVNQVDLEIKDQEFLVLVGPSGCGKSTLLRMIAGLEEITSGNIIIGGRRVNDMAPKDRDIAMVFQNYALYPHMSVYDNLAFGLRLRGVPKAVVAERVQQAASILGLEALLRRKPKEMSGGQRQRVALGRAIVREPKVFLMDEPLSNLDAKLRVQMRAELIKLHQRLRTTVIYVTHDQVEAMTMGSRIAVIKDGLLQQVDSPQQIYQKPANMFVAEFIGSPAMNFFPARLNGQPGNLQVESATFQLALPQTSSRHLSAHVGREVVLGIRPEHMVHRQRGQDTRGNVIRAKVDVVETLGSEAIVYLMTGEHGFVARTHYDPTVRSGEDVEMVVGVEQIHLFDPQTQAVLE